MKSFIHDQNRAIGYNSINELPGGTLRTERCRQEPVAENHRIVGIRLGKFVNCCDPGFNVTKSIERQRLCEGPADDWMDMRVDKAWQQQLAAEVRNHGVVTREG